MRDYAKAISIESLFSEFFFRKHEIPIPGYSAFEQLNKMGKLLLIFDGFDEMADRIDRQKMVNNFWELARVVTGNSKVMLTCRNEHFPEAQESRTILNAELKASVSNLTGESPQFEVLELQRLDDDQIRQLLSFYTTEKTVDEIMKNQELLDLARRPVMTELIVEALPEIEAGKPIDMSRIYLYAVTRKMRRDVKEQRTFTSMADKLYFMCELSWEMFSTDNMSLNYKLFPQKIRSLFSGIVEEQTDLDHWHYDMMGQTMLIRDENGNYTPAHRSLLEFFTAFKLAAELGILALDFIEIAKEQSYINPKLLAQPYTWSTYFTHRKSGDLNAPLRFFKGEKIANLVSSFGEIVLTKSLQDLLINMISISSEETQIFFTNLINWCRGRKWEEVGFLATNSVIILLRYQNDFFKGKNLSNLCLYGLSVEEQVNYNNDLYHNKSIDLSGTNFQNSDLRFADLSKSILTGSDLSNTMLDSTRFNIENFFSILDLEQENLVALYFHNNLVIINTDKNKLHKRIFGLIDAVLELSIDKKHLVTRYKNGFKLIEVKTLTVVAKYTNPFPEDSNLFEFLFLKKSNWLIIGGESSNIYIWDIQQERILNTLTIPQEVDEAHVSVFRFSLSNNEKFILIHHDEGIEMLDIESKIFHKISHSEKQIHYIIFHQHFDEYIFVESETNQIKIHNSSSRKFSRAINIDLTSDIYSGVESLHLNRDGSIIAIVYQNKALLYNYTDGVLISRIESQYSEEEEDILEKDISELSDLGQYNFEMGGAIFNENGKTIHFMSWGYYFLTFNIQTGQLEHAFCNIEGVEGANFSSAKGIDKGLAEQLKNNAAIIEPKEY